MDRNRKIVLSAVVISLTAHAAFLAWAPYIHFSGMKSAMEESRRIFKLGSVEEKPSVVDLYEKEKNKVPALKMSAEDTEAKEKALRDMLLMKKPEDEKLVDDKKKENAEEILPSFEDKFKAEESIMSDAEKAKKDAEPLKRKLLNDIPQGALADASRPEGPYKVIASKQGSSSFMVQVSASDEWVPSSEQAFSAGENELRASQGRVQVGQYEDIGESLGLKLTTYVDPVTGEKYFKIVIAAKKGNNLEVIPKEIIFLIDSSKSITEQKLRYIKEGVLGALG
ncbi:MAG: hypothetical protein ABH883_09275, partial [Candidatus Omnitrophota bacterium]